MTDMELVVKIPKEAYNSLSMLDDRFLSGAELILKHGTPLPKGHGRLIDADACKKNLVENTANDAEAVGTLIVSALLETRPTIIEADKEDKE